jgi:hypothetical protein
VLDLATGQWRTLIEGGYDARYAGGYLLYMANGELHAAAFDAERLRVRGGSARVLPGVSIGNDLGSNFDVAANGTLVYLDAARAAAGRFLVWVDRTGRETRLDGAPRPYSYPRISPDGARVAVYVRDQARDRDIWILDLLRGSMARLTFGPEIDSWPIWLANDRIAFTSQRQSGIGNIFVQEISGGGDARQASDSAAPGFVASGALPDGSALVLSRLAASTSDASMDASASGWDVQLLSLPPPGSDVRTRPERLAGLDSGFSERNPVVSPDGRWIAYESDSVGGQFEIFVRPFPDTAAGLWQISAGGGQQPLWAATGRELFYLGPDGTLMAVAVSPQDSVWSSATPQAIFRGDYVMMGGGNSGRQYDVAPDGERFLMIKDAGVDRGDLNQIVVMQNWIESLGRSVPGL